MHPTRRSIGLLGAIMFILIPTLASAQSSITGEVTDNTGGVLPGVTVEATSPTLIEGSRVAVTGGQGRYTIVDLRPGVYTVTFTLPGFSTVIREGLELTADFTQTLNAQMAVGGIEETITVSGEAPVVDVQSAARTETLSRDTIDALPTPRNTQSIGYLAQGVRLSRPDVGGSQMMEQVYMISHGANQDHTNMEIDGMKVNSAMGDGRIMNYNNQALSQEMAVTTSGQSAEVSAGGVRLNMIPKDGGNTISGAVYVGWTDGAWQADNVDDALRDRGLDTPNRISNIHDINPSVGGPFIANRLWWFASARAISVDEGVVNAPPLPDGSPAIVEQYVRSGLVRITGQVTPRNKVSAYLDRIFKFKDREFVFGVEPLKASSHRDPDHANYHTFQAKWTSTISNRTLLEVGYSQVYERLLSEYQPGVMEQKPDDLRTCVETPCYHPAGYDQTRPWFAKVSHYDFINDQRTEARQSGLSYTGPVDRFYPNAKLTHLAGAHNLRVGMQWSYGPDGNAREMNGHLNQEYAGVDADGNLIPDRVEIYNAPTWGTVYVKRDLGLYAQDTWTMDRLTVNAGVRFELFKAINEESGGPAGRFVPARAFAEQQDVPLWNDVAPRFSIVYDLFGDARTALKFGINKYMQPMTGSIGKRYLLGTVLTDDRDWFDCALDPAIFATGVATCSGDPAYASTDRDDIAQDHEIGLVNNRPLFLERTSTGRRLADDHARPYNVEWNASIQHEVAPRVSVTAAYYHRQFYNLEGQDNLLVDPTDYVGFPVVNPLNGETFTLYNLDPELRGVQDIVDSNSDTNRNTYDGIELSMQARLQNGGLVSFGWTGQKWVQNSCDQENPNGLRGLDFNDRTTVIVGGRFCDQSTLGMPFRHDFKSQWAYPFPYGIWFSGTFQSYAGAMRSVEWTVPTSVFEDAGLVRTETTRVDLLEPGTEFLDRWNQVDIAFRKETRIGGYDFSTQVDVYNVNNSNVVLTETESYGPTLGTPNTILTGRLMRLAFQLKW